jgi:hypothetical protein
VFARIHPIYKGFGPGLPLRRGGDKVVVFGAGQQLQLSHVFFVAGWRLPLIVGAVKEQESREKRVSPEAKAVNPRVGNRKALPDQASKLLPCGPR